VLERAAEARLGVAHRLFGLDAVGDVARRRVDQAVLGVGAPRPLDPAEAAVLGEITVEQRCGPLARPQPRGGALRALAVVGVHELDERARLELLRRPAERVLPGAVER